jgi:hypothetical protein
LAFAIDVCPGGPWYGLYRQDLPHLKGVYIPLLTIPRPKGGAPFGIPFGFALERIKGTEIKKSFDTLLIPEKLRMRRSAKIPAPAGFFLSLEGLIILFRSD